MPRRRVPKALALFLLVRTFVFATDTAPPLSFTRLADIRSLSPVEAERGHPAEVHGIITYVNPDTGSLFVQDGADGIYVFLSESKADVPPQRGQRVTVKGITTAGRFAPSLTKATITVDGFGGLPAPKKLEFDYLMAGREDSLLDEVSGIVRSGQIIGTQLWLGIASNGGAFLARVRIFPHDWKLRLVDATVTVRGVIASTYNDHRQSIGMQMMVSDAGDIHILVPPQPDVFKLPVSPTTAGGDSVGQVWTTASTSGALSSALSPVLCTWPTPMAVWPLSPGQLRISEPATQSTSPVFLAPLMGGPDCRMPFGELVEPRSCRSPDPFAEIDSRPKPLFRLLRRPLQAGIRNDVVLVQTEVKLLQTRRNPLGHSLVVEAEGRQFLATLSLVAGEQFRPLESGSKLRPTGLCLVICDQFPTCTGGANSAARPAGYRCPYPPSCARCGLPTARVRGGRKPGVFPAADSSQDRVPGLAGNALPESA